MNTAKILKKLPKSTSDLNKFLRSKAWYIFFILMVIGLFIRFDHITYVQGFGWDQARDAWVVRDILRGNLIAVGPNIGTSNMHLGPVYYYFLAPFYLLTNLDPVGSLYFNFVANIINFVLIFYVAKKIFGSFVAIMTIFFYTFSHYLIILNQTPWNVSLMPGVAALIFLSLYNIYEEKYNWVFVLWALTGFYWNLHYTAIFFPIINILSLLFVKDKKKVLLYSVLSIPLFIIWFLPNIYSAIAKGTDKGTINDFLSHNYIGFHLRFMLHRLPDALIQFEMIISYNFIKYLKYILPVIFMIVIFLEKDKKKRLLAYLISLWFIVPLFIFTLYGGPISDYYFLYSAPMVLFILAYLQEKLLQLKFIPVLIMLIFFWGYYISINTRDLWVKPISGGLVAKKEYVKSVIANHGTIQYNEGDIHSYLYTIWTKK